jgi:hypothetical protein
VRCLPFFIFGCEHTHVVFMQSFSIQQTGRRKTKFLILVGRLIPLQQTALDALPVDSDQVKEWMKELDGWNIPNLNATVDGTCVGDPAAAADAANRGWWTCGGYTRSDGIFHLFHA